MVTWERYFAVWIAGSFFMFVAQSSGCAACVHPACCRCVCGAEAQKAAAECWGCPQMCQASCCVAFSHKYSLFICWSCRPKMPLGKQSLLFLWPLLLLVQFPKLLCCFMCSQKIWMGPWSPSLAPDRRESAPVRLTGTRKYTSIFLVLSASGTNSRVKDQFSGSELLPTVLISLKFLMLQFPWPRMRPI